MLKKNLANFDYFNKILHSNEYAEGERPPLIEQNCRVLNEAFSNNIVNNEIPDIIFLLERNL